MMMRMDFIANKTEWSLLYDDNVYSDENAEQIIQKCAIHDFDNICLKNNAKCFFLPTSKADFLQTMVTECINEEHKRIKCGLTEL